MDGDGTLRYVNEAALQFGGVAREDIVGEKIWDTDLLCWSDRVRQQLRADTKRAANGEFVRHEMEVQGDGRSRTIDFSITPFTTEFGNKTRLLAEGQNITQLMGSDGALSRAPSELPKNNLLIAYSRDSDETMNQSITEAFLALDIDIFELDTTLEDWVNTDALNRLAWDSDGPLTIISRIWDYDVVLSNESVRIFGDA